MTQAPITADAEAGTLAPVSEAFAPTPLHSYRGRLPYPIWLVYRAVRTTAVASAFAGFWLGATLLAWSVLPLVSLVARDPRRACQRVISASFRFFHGYMRLLRLFDARRIGPLPPVVAGKAVVLIANHTTLVDVTAILSQMPHVCCIAKAKYTSSPFFGRLLSLCGFIGAGETIAERADTVRIAKERLKEGYHVLVFPEGTRSPERSLLPFQRGAFEIACQADVPLVPLVLRCDPSALRLGQRFWQQPDESARLTFEVDEPVDPAKFDHKSRPMRQAVEQRYRSRLGLPPRSGYKEGRWARTPE